MVNEKEPCLNNLFRDKGYYRGEGTHLAFEGRLVTPARLPETKELALDRLIWREERLILTERLRPPYLCRREDRPLQTNEEVNQRRPNRKSRQRDRPALRAEDVEKLVND
ncbi:unnamed protein product [Prunus armeniaca]